jgi:hypothetical protein
MKLFNDKECKQEVVDIDLGLVDAGDVKEYSYYLQNDTLSRLVEIQIALTNRELNVIKAPMELNPYEAGEIVVKWNCAIDIKEGLKSELSITAKEIYS